jgi:hypothetical protein
VPLVYKGNGAGGRSFALTLNANGSLTASTTDATGLQSVTSSAGAVRAGSWNHVSAVIDRATGRIRLFAGDVQVGEGTIRTGRRRSDRGDPAMDRGRTEADASRASKGRSTRCGSGPARAPWSS